MTPQQIAAQLQARFTDRITAGFPADKHPRVHTTAAAWRELAHFLRHDPALAFDWLACASAIDYVAQDQLAMIYDLRSTTQGHSFAVKVFVVRATPVIPSVSDLWPAANWHEREAYDMMGITFTDHPDPRRILLPEDWEGFPLRKDYIFPRQYHGIPGSYEMDWQQKPEGSK